MKRSGGGWRGFSLLELLVVMAVVALLLGLAVPVYQRVAESGRAAGCVSNLRQLGAGLNLYLGDHEMIMPTMAAGRATKEEEVSVIDNTLNPYVPATSAFGCPADDIWLETSGTSFHWNNALNGQSAATLNFLGVIVERGKIPVLADKGKRRDGSPVHPYLESKINILYADGHASKELSFITTP